MRSAHLEAQLGQWACPELPGAATPLQPSTCRPGMLLPPLWQPRHACPPVPLCHLPHAQLVPALQVEGALVLAVVHCREKGRLHRRQASCLSWRALPAQHSVICGTRFRALSTQQGLVAGGDPGTQVPHLPRPQTVQQSTASCPRATQRPARPGCRQAVGGQGGEATLAQPEAMLPVKHVQAAPQRPPVGCKLQNREHSLVGLSCKASASAANPAQPWRGLTSPPWCA